MPVLHKEYHRKLSKELNDRFSVLTNAFEGRELINASEGARGTWLRPKDKRATNKSALEIRLAVDDFKTILSEIRKLK